LAFEDGAQTGSRPAFVQRLAALKADPRSVLPPEAVRLSGDGEFTRSAM
jgi:hypothetical protein